MNAHEITESMLGETGLPQREISRRAGYYPTYVHDLIRRDITPKADALARIADACGYDLLVRRRIDEYEMIIDPYD